MPSLARIACFLLLMALVAASEDEKKCWGSDKVDYIIYSDEDCSTAEGGLQNMDIGKCYEFTLDNDANFKVVRGIGKEDDSDDGYGFTFMKSLDTPPTVEECETIQDVEMTTSGHLDPDDPGSTHCSEVTGDTGSATTYYGKWTFKEVDCPEEEEPDAEGSGGGGSTNWGLIGGIIGGIAACACCVWIAQWSEALGCGEGCGCCGSA